MTSRAEQLEQFEQKIGRPLPLDYREFLMNGPLPVWEGECDPENQATYILFSLWDVGRGDYTDLAKIWEERHPELPDWFLEIAEIYDGVKLGVGLDGDQTGQVYSFTWDTGEPQLHSTSFRTFLDRLHAEGGSFDDRQ